MGRIFLGRCCGRGGSGGGGGGGCIITDVVAGIMIHIISNFIIPIAIITVITVIIVSIVVVIFVFLEICYVLCDDAPDSHCTVVETA